MKKTKLLPFLFASLLLLCVKYTNIEEYVTGYTHIKEDSTTIELEDFNLLLDNQADYVVVRSKEDGASMDISSQGIGLVHIADETINGNPIELDEKYYAEDYEGEIILNNNKTDIIHLSRSARMNEFGPVTSTVEEGRYGVTIETEDETLRVKVKDGEMFYKFLEGEAQNER